MTTNTHDPRTRVPAGVPTGGEFAPTTHAESGVSLTDPADTAGGEVADADSTGSVVETDTVFTRRYKTIEDKISAFQGELDQGVADLATDENWQHYLATMAKFHRYSPTNQLLIQLQSDGRATWVAGFNKWKQIGRTVKKGEKGIGVLAPRAVRATRKDSDGKPVTDTDGKPVKDRKVVGFTTAAVFDVSQTEGEPLPQNETHLSEDPPQGFTEDLHTAVESEGFAVRYADLPGDQRQGWTDPSNREVVIDADMPAGSQAATLAHELGHIKAGHLDRLADYHLGGCRGQMEVEAESVAYVLTRANGMSDHGRKVSSTYVAGWSNSDPETLKTSADLVSKTCKDILGSGTFRNATDDET